MSDRFQELQVFVRAAETGSFSAAARELGLSQPSISRIISELESRLGTRLLLRSTRRIVPTEAGLAYLHQARQVLFDLEEADQTAMGMDSISGILRVALAPIFAVRIVIPALGEFLETHPKLKVELLTSDSLQDLVAEAADMAIRFGRLQDSSFGAKTIGVEQRLLIAAPSYLATVGALKSPTDLPSHHCIGGPGASGGPTWTFNQAGKSAVVKIQPRLRVGSAEAAIASASAGLGFAIAPAWLCKTEIEAGMLVSVLPEWKQDPVEAHAVYPAGRTPSKKVRLFTDFLTGILGVL